MRSALTTAALLGLAQAGALAAPLAPSSGNIALSGTLAPEGSYEIRATLQGGNFSGSAKLTLGGQTLEAPLLEKRSYLENGKCYFRFEQGRARGELSGNCDSAAFEGRFETFLAGDLRNGKQTGRVTLAGGAAATAAAGALPTAKLTCAYQDRKFSAKWGEATQYSLHFSNMATLTLRGGQYSAGKSSSGSFERLGKDKIRLTSGTWAGAVGTLEPDRSGRPAVVFNVEENRRADGVHIVDPYTTHCTEARP